jgi:hypothetical protein
MADRISFSGQHLELPEIITHHSDVESSLRGYFNPTSASYSIRFAGYDEAEVRSELEVRLVEHHRTTILTILSALEAAFRIDYLQRCYKKKKDPLSRGLRELHRKTGSRASLEDEIFDKWKEYTSVPNKLIGELKGAFKYRHWLAHGRYYEPKLGQKYDYDSVYVLAETILSSFPLEGINHA